MCLSGIVASSGVLLLGHFKYVRSMSSERAAKVIGEQEEIEGGKVSTQCGIASSNNAVLHADLNQNLIKRAKSLY